MKLLNRLPRLHLAIYGWYLAVAVLITWPLVTVISTHFAGYPFGDAHEMTRHIWWIKHALQTGQPLIFQPLLAYPDGLQGVILWSNPLQFFPGWLLAFFMPLPAAYNIFVLLTLALNGWAAHWLVWKLTNQRPAALLSGMVFMVAPVMQGHLAGGHGGLLVQWPLPLLAYYLLVVCDLLPAFGGQRSAFGFQPDANRQPLTTQHSALSTLFFFLTPLGHTLQLIYAVLPLVAVLGVTVLLRRDWRALRRLAGVVMLGSVLLGLFLLPVFSATFGTSAYTAEGGGVDYSADLLGIVTPSFNHPLYGQLDYTRRVLGVNIVEGSSYVGIVAGLLGVVALWKVPISRWWLGLGGVAWLLSLGPLLKIFDAPLIHIIGGYETRFTLPWALLYDLPGFSLARTPGRFNFLLALAVAVLAGYGVLAISHRLSAFSQKLSANRQSPRTRYSLLAVVFLSLLIVFDYQSFWPLPTFDTTIPQAVYALGQRADVRAVFDVPWDNLLAAKDALWLQTAHQKPMIAGQVTRRTPVSPAKLAILEQTLDAALLNEAGADVVIVHRHYDTDGKLADRARRQFGESFYEDAQVALFAVTRAGDQPQWVETFDQSQVFTNGLQAYLYTATSGWLNLELRPTADNRVLSFSVDGNGIQKWRAGFVPTTIWLPLTEPGYHTIAVEASPTCPDRYSPGLVCVPPSLTLNIVPPFEPTAFGTDIAFERGLRLVLSPLIKRSAGKLTLSLWWQFDQPRSQHDIRFIKVLNEQGEPVAAVDETLGDHAANSQWVETVYLDLAADLPSGSYSVYVGWYTYPDLNRFKVLTDVAGRQDGWALIGTFTVDRP